MLNQARTLPVARRLARDEAAFALSADFPGVAGAQELGKVAFALLGLYVVNLLRDDVLVARHIVPLAQHSDRSGEAGTMFHVAQHERVGRPRMMLVVDKQVLFS